MWYIKLVDIYIFRLVLLFRVIGLMGSSSFMMSSTPMLLSCRVLDVNVGRTAVDVQSLVASRRILLRSAAMGDATMVFDGDDWRNFLDHPLMAAAIDDASRPVREFRSSDPASRFAMTASSSPCDGETTRS